MPRPIFQALDLASMDLVVGGALVLDEYGQPTRPGLGLLEAGEEGDEQSGDYGFGDGLNGIDGMDTSGVDASPYSPEDIFNAQVDIMQNYWDGVTPMLAQGPADCYIVSTLNSIASTNAGQEYLASLITQQGDGFVVSLHTADGQPLDVWVSSNDLNYTGASAGDGTLQLIELALGIAHAGDNDGSPYDGSLNAGGRPESIMVELGLSAGLSDATTAAGFEANSNGVFVVGTNGDTTALATYGLESNHAYSVIGTVTNGADGQTYVVLSNPWGTNHPQPIPVSELGNLFQSTSVGQLPAPATNTGDPPPPTDSSGGGQ